MPVRPPLLGAEALCSAEGACELVSTTLRYTAAQAPMKGWSSASLVGPGIFILANNNSPADQWQCLSFSPSGRSLWVTTGFAQSAHTDDYGRTWTAHPQNGRSGLSKTFGSSAIDPTGTKFIYGGSGTVGGYLSEDSGLTWTAFNSPLSSIYKYFWANGQWYCHDGSSNIYKSSNPVSGWTFVDNYATEFNSSSLLIEKICTPGPGMVFMVASDAVTSYTLDSGATWKVAAPNMLLGFVSLSKFTMAYDVKRHRLFWLALVGATTAVVSCPIDTLESGLGASSHILTLINITLLDNRSTLAILNDSIITGNSVVYFGSVHKQASAVDSGLTSASFDMTGYINNFYPIQIGPNVMYHDMTGAASVPAVRIEYADFTPIQVQQ